MLAVKHREQTIEASDGTRLWVERWEPEQAPRFAVVFVHGGAEHVGRYDRMARELEPLGGLSLGLDHRGQGKSGGVPGHVSSFGEYARDLRQVIETVAEELPAGQRPDAIPWFLFGHSMGGLISLTYLLDHAKAIPLGGAIISSPLIEVAVKVNPLKRMLGTVASHLAPRLSLPAGIPPEGICRDAAEVRRYIDDKRRITAVTAGWFGAMNAAIARVKQEASTIETPCLWYVGTGDLICSHEATMAVFRTIPDAEARGHSLHVFAGYYHELHNEPDELRVPVIELVHGWLQERVDAGG